MGRRSRRKGAAFERQTARRLREVGIPADRNLSECRTGNAGDLSLPDHVPLVVQCKTGKRPNVWTAVREAQEAAGSSGRHPVGVVHRDAPRPGEEAVDVAVLPLSDFLRLIEQLVTSGAWE